MKMYLSQEENGVSNPGFRQKVFFAFSLLILRELTVLDWKCGM